MSHRSFAAAFLALLLTAPAVPRPQSGDVVDRVASYFAICDRDGQGWVSYREARDSLGLDRRGFATFDTDRDGRIDLEEFRAGYAELAARVGTLPSPRSADGSRPDLPRRPTQILAAYDANADVALDAEELEQLLADYGRADIPVATALEKLDQDGSSMLRGVELELLSRLLSTLHVAGQRELSGAEAPRTVDDLFGRTQQREEAVDTAPHPPLIVGPVLPFRRLDLDGDGGISVSDLRELMSPLQFDVSLAAVHATLDTDEDGRIDRDELARALGSAR